MQSLIIPAAFLLFVGVWGVWETGRKFRREFKNRGIQWALVCDALSRGQGTLVVDTLWGPQRGLGHPVIWWLPGETSADADLVSLLQSGARLVNCPKPLKSADALRDRFGDRVLVHSWDFGPALAEARQEPLMENS